MKILLVHNRYLIGGGEDVVFQTELNLLRENGHQVYTFLEDNRQVSKLGGLPTALRSIWSFESYRKVRRMIREAQVDIVHVHNFFPLISPAIYHAARAERTPVVQTLHNYRLLCLNGYLLRDGHLCRDCLGRLPLSGVRHACYRGNKAGSLAVALMLVLHRLMRTWQSCVDGYIVLAPFAGELFIAGGLPSELIHVKPNCLHPDPDVGNGNGAYALFVGRLSEEKGVHTLLAAWERMQLKFPLKIIGDGPLSGEVNAAVQRLAMVEWLNRQTHESTLAAIKKASCLIVSSICYEAGVPRTIIEAFACGTPVIVSKLGAMCDMIQNGSTGLHFHPGDAYDLADKVHWLFDHPTEVKQMRKAARKEFESHYAADKNYDQLMAIYEQLAHKY